MKGVEDVAKQKVADLQKQKDAAGGQTKGFDAMLKAELKKISEKYAVQKSALQGEEKKLAGEKAAKAAALAKEKAIVTKEKAALEKDFAKIIKKEVGAMAAGRAAELKKLKGELAAVTKQLEKHEAAKEEILMNALMAIDTAYETKSSELDMKLGTENKRLQDENKKFDKEKKGHSFVTGKQIGRAHV